MLKNVVIALCVMVTGATTVASAPVPARVAVGAGAAAGPGVATATGALERGRYLVEAVMACDNCHTPRDEHGFDMTRRFSGGTEVWETPAYRVQGTNITPDRDTGIGAWSADDLKQLLTQGVRPNGVRVAPQMPYGLYRTLTPSDLDSVVRYVRTIKPVRREMPPPVYKTASYAGPVLPARPATAGPMPHDARARGSYLASLAYCMACHSRRPDGVLDLKNWWGKGGFDMKGTFGAVVASNITSDRKNGVGALSDAELKRALTEGIGPDGRVFKLPMARQDIYGKMTPQDLDAIIAWLRGIPPG